MDFKMHMAKKKVIIGIGKLFQYDRPSESFQTNICRQTNIDGV